MYQLYIQNSKHNKNALREIGEKLSKINSKKLRRECSIIFNVLHMAPGSIT
jgi:hypothetical protein